MFAFNVCLYVIYIYIYIYIYIICYIFICVYSTLLNIKIFTRLRKSVRYLSVANDIGNEQGLPS